MNIKEYFVSIFKGFHSLIKGMEVTGVELVTPKVTEQYPENRAELHIPERFRATLEFIYDENGGHKCIACGSCERNCPNQTISITKRMVDLPDGKKKMKLDKYMYDLGSCTFCGLCVQVCPPTPSASATTLSRPCSRARSSTSSSTTCPRRTSPLLLPHRPPSLPRLLLHRRLNKKPKKIRNNGISR